MSESTPYDLGDDRVINARTLIPIGVYASTIGVVIGGAFWLFNIHASAQEALRTAQNNQQAISALVEDNVDVVDRMARIETKIDLLIQSLAPNLTIQ